MDIRQITPGRNPPIEVNAFVEIPQGGQPVKYELDQQSGALFVDRFLHSSMIYPSNYGFIPGTLGEDGDPLDILVVTPIPVVAGSVIRSRTIGVLLMDDEKGVDEKILAVPVDALNPFYAEVKTHRDLPPLLVDQIRHFFMHYKDLEPAKTASVGDWADLDVAHERIMLAIDRYDKKPHP
jgi:inorganic pyrophosphatase